MKKIYSFATFTIITFLSISMVNACSCLQPGLPEEAVSNGEYIFSGFVNKIEKTDDLFLAVEVSLKESWGNENLDNTVTVITANNSAACGYEFELGEEYFIYATKEEDNTFATNLCSRTKDLEQAYLTDIPYIEQITYTNDNGVETSIPHYVYSKYSTEINDGADKNLTLILGIVFVTFFFSGAYFYAYKSLNPTKHSK